MSLLRALAALLLALALLPTRAAAIDPAPAGRPAYGTVIVLKDRRAGFFEDVRKVSREVTYVRDGIERAVPAGLVVHEGDAIRTAAGSCVVETPEGWRVEVGERAQVRLEPTVLQRLGRVFYRVRGAFSVRVDEVQILVEGTAFQVDRDLAGAGEVVVPEGAVRLRAPVGEERVREGHALQFTQDGPGALRGVTAEDLAAIEAWRAERFAPTVAAGLRRNRLVVRARGGVGWFDGGRSWGGGGLEVRGRAYGPLWLGGGAGILARAVDETAEARTAFVLPVHLGARLLADLPASFFLGGGVDLELMVGQRCVDPVSCERVAAVEPGVLLSATGGLLLTRRLGVDLEFRGGLLRRVLPAADPSLPPTAVVDPRFDLAVAFFLRL